ncbi:MAG TPA: alpha/beta hydrolase [Roseiflexaceae bacterium]|nr:alpha/beta hydrolase [Roseiflexaceae bacterium]
MDTLLPGGAYREIDLPQGRVRFFDRGEGPTLVFLHGLLVNSQLWRKVIPPLLGRYRCIAPDLPLGAHTLPMRPDADLSPLGVARLIADLLEALGLREVTLVGNDTGGALAQLVVAHHPERIDRLALTNCDAFEVFPPRLLDWLIWGARRFGTRFIDTLCGPLSTRAGQRLLLAAVSRSHHAPDLLDAYSAPMLRSAEVRRDMARFTAAISSRDTLAAAERFPLFTRPVHLLWGTNDLFFSQQLARRLQAAFPNATLELVSGSRTFVPEDQPAALVQRLAAWVPVEGRTKNQEPRTEHLAVA